jgi:hypothetical protein
MYNKNNTRRFIRYFRRTLKQKLYAVAMVAAGIVSVPVSDGDITFLVLMSCLAVPMFISRENWIA